MLLSRFACAAVLATAVMAFDRSHPVRPLDPGKTILRRAALEHGFANGTSRRSLYQRQNASALNPSSNVSSSLIPSAPNPKPLNLLAPNSSAYPPDNAGIAAASQSTGALAFLNSLWTYSLALTPQCNRPGGGCQVLSATLNDTDCASDLCACDEEVTLFAQVCVECVALPDAVDGYNAYIEGCVDEGLQRPSETVSLAILSQSRDPPSENGGAGAGAVVTPHVLAVGQITAATSTPPTSPTPSPPPSPAPVAMIGQSISANSSLHSSSPISSSSSLKMDLQAVATPHTISGDSAEAGLIASNDEQSSVERPTATSTPTLSTIVPSPGSVSSPKADMLAAGGGVDSNRYAGISDESSTRATANSSVGAGSTALVSTGADGTALRAATRFFGGTIPSTCTENARFGKVSVLDDVCACAAEAMLSAQACTACVGSLGTDPSNMTSEYSSYFTVCTSHNPAALADASSDAGLREANRTSSNSTSNSTYSSLGMSSTPSLSGGQTASGGGPSAIAAAAEGATTTAEEGASCAKVLAPRRLTLLAIGLVGWATS